MRPRKCVLLLTICAAAAFIVTVVVCFALISARRDDLTLVERSEAGGNTETVAEFVDSILLRLISRADAIGDLPWTAKLLPNNETINETYFSSLRKMEITQEIQTYNTPDMYCGRMMLVFPYSDICVMTNIWTDMRFALSILKVPEEQKNDIIDGIMSVNGIARVRALEKYVNDLTLCVPIERLKKPRAYIVCFMDSTRIRTAVGGILAASDNITEFTIHQDAESVFSIKTSGEPADFELSRKSHYIGDWNYTVRYKSDLRALGFNEYVYKTALIGLTLYISTVALAYVCYTRVYAPITHTLEKLSEYNRSETKMHNLDKSVSELIRSNADSMRVKLISRLLKRSSESEKLKEDMERNGLSISDDDMCQAILLTLVNQSESESDILTRLNFERVESVRIEALGTIKNEFVIICISVAPESLKSQTQAIASAARRENWGCFAGEAFKGVGGLSASFERAQALERNSRDTKILRCHFPLEWENLLVRSIRGGNSQTTRRLLDDVRRVNEERLYSGDMGQEDYSQLLDLLDRCIQRLALENGFEDADVYENDGKSFDRLALSCMALCDAFASANMHDKARRITEYLRSAYHDPQLSLGSVSEKLEISENTLNKYLKEECDDTFLSYLTKIRVEKSKELLGNSQMSVADIARAVGYESDIVFRRAFRRVTGVSPRYYSETGDIKAENRNDE